MIPAVYRSAFRSRENKLWIPVLILCLGPASYRPAQAQGFDAKDPRQPTDLAAGWLLHVGDDPAYARPDFDVSDWTPHKPHKGQENDGLHGLLPQDCLLIFRYRPKSILVFALGMLLGFAFVMLLAWVLFRRRRLDWLGPQLRELPVHRLRYLLAADFLRSATLGFLVDALFGGSFSRSLVLVLASVSGVFGPVDLLFRHRSPLQRMLFTLPLVLIVYGIVISHWHIADVPSSTAAAAYRFDAFAICVTMLASTYLTTAHINTEGMRQLRAEAEIANAREVQQIIVPDSVESIPGFRIDSSYVPAREVGGDFFQIIPIATDGMLVVIGDVAGKGLPAAMLVSVLVGAIRTIVRYSHSSAEILAELNERMIGRTHGGFSTALAALFSADGSVTIANAGHLSPYLDGREIELHGALPLGIVSPANYQATQLCLEPGSRLTFYSDGVIEAQDKKGTLFGFERGKDISTQPAAQIVKAAQEFGQEDDITVVVIQREARVPAATSDELIHQQRVIPSTA